MGAVLAGVCFLPWGAGFFFWVALVPLYWAVDGKSPGRAFLLGWSFGSVAWGVGMFWLFNTIRNFTPLALPVVVAAFLLLCAGHGLMAGCWAGTTRILTRRLSRKWGGRPYLALAAVSVPALVWGQAYFPALFPVPFSASQYPHLAPLQSLELFGTGGLDWLIVGFNAAVYIALRSWSEGRARTNFLLGMMLLVGLNWLYGEKRLRAVEAQTTQAVISRPFFVGLVQSAIPVASGRGRKELKLSALNRLTRQALASGPLNLAVWPETSYEAVLDRPIDARTSASLKADIPAPVPVLFGTIAGERWATPPRFFNVAVLSDAKRRVLGAQEKSFLMPFGESMPLGDLFPGLYRLSPHTSRLTRASQLQLLELGKARLGALICYEDVIPAYVRAFAGLGANLLVVLANDGWITEPGREVHLRLSALRAIETRRFLVRAVNDGVSAVIDPAGRITQRIVSDREGTLSAAVALLDSRPLELRLGGLPYALAALLWLVLAAWAWRK